MPIDACHLQSSIVWHHSDGVGYVGAAVHGCDSQVSFKSIPHNATDLGTLLFHFLIIFPCVVFQYGRRVFHQAHPLKLPSPGLFLLGATGLFFVAIQYLPLADAIAILFLMR